MGTDRFPFLDPGPLFDGELELVQPRPSLIDDYLATCAHPLTQRDAPAEAGTTRSQLRQLLKAAPLGREPADALRGRVPQYHFWMRLSCVPGAAPPPVGIGGGIGLRIGSTPAIEMLYGHFGYHVLPPARGRHYAERSCRLLLPLARRHGLTVLWITCNPDNLASRATCERLGATLVEIISVPPDEPLFARGDREKCRYRLKL